MGQVLLLLTLSGCGGALYASKASTASSRLEEAKKLSAEELAPYEFYSAMEFFKKAQEEAAFADYGDAVALAERSAEFSEIAIRLSGKAHRSGGQ